ncbi:MAG: hypothetical protein WDN69_29310 [Aliidongia sp.]
MAVGHKADIDPTAFSIVNDRLYLNYSKGRPDALEGRCSGLCCQGRQGLADGVAEHRGGAIEPRSVEDLDAPGHRIENRLRHVATDVTIRPFPEIVG